MEDILNLTSLLSSLKRRWWMPIAGLVLGAAAAVVIADRLPRVYRASTLILVEPQKIPVAYVRPTVTMSIEDRLRSLQQQITSRSRVERVIRELNLFPDEIDSVPLEFLVGRVAARTKLDIRGTNSFRIIYEGLDPKQVAIVANKMADLVIEENTAARQREADSTSKFLEREQERVKLQLQEEEDNIARFKREHLGELPEQADANLRTLEALQQRLRAVGESLSRARDRRLLLENQLAELPAGGTSVSQLELQLEQARAKMLELQDRYTEKHPDVAMQRKEVERLEALLTAQPEPDPAGGAGAQGNASNTSLYAGRLRVDVQAVDAEIKGYVAEEQQLRQDIARYQERVESAPRNEAILSTLTRDYQNLAANYQSLLNKKLEADLAGKLEEERRGEQFNVVDRAIPPSIPFKPNPTQIMAFGSALGLILGSAAAISLDLFRPRFRREQELLAAFNIPVLAAIPTLLSEENRRKAVRRVRLLIGSGIAAAAIGLLLFLFLVTGR